MDTRIFFERIHNKLNHKFHILWFTGMSGSGKTTLAIYAKKVCKDLGYKVKIIDGDDIRSSDEKKLSFDYNDVCLNNLRIAQLCLDLKDHDVDIVIVPIISPYKKVRRKVKKLLEPFMHLIYIKADIESLKERDTRGLYAASDSGEIDNLIGYSATNPYEEPSDPLITIDTGNKTTIKESKNILYDYILKEIFNF